MRRADRLFAILQMLRGGRLRRAEDIAESLEVSVRTVYRDVADLQSHGVPVDGERGIGYLLRDGHFLPPLALSPDEMDALRWGVAFVRAYGDEALASAAQELQIKLDKANDHALTKGPYIMPSKQATATSADDKAVRRMLGIIRKAVRISYRLEIDYRDLNDLITNRKVRPLSLEHWGTVWTLTCWCELRADFRCFRVDHLTDCRMTPERFAPEAGKRLSDYLSQSTGKTLQPLPAMQ
ncbi:MAG: helix-turn-helix transcriptional regulator [Beijerinckiaceae bacterium]